MSGPLKIWPMHSFHAQTETLQGARAVRTYALFVYIVYISGISAAVIFHTLLCDCSCVSGEAQAGEAEKDKIDRTKLSRDHQGRLL